ncbi:MAG: radical SAM protein [Candidatus Omnitrophota bacterium]|nr:radical SAM protein [Candidatus Omnitrophota bacterium]
MKISFLFPCWTEVFGKFSKLAQKTSGFPPLNIAILAAIAQKAGHEVQIIDGEIEGLNNQEIIKRVKDFSPDLIGMTGTTPGFHLVVRLAKELKEQMDVPIMAGGHHVTLFKEKIFDNCFDFLFVSEADISFADFLKVYQKNDDLSNVKGLIFRRKGEIVFTGNPGLTQDLDVIPFPARGLLKFDKYKVGTLHGTLNYTSIMTTRGCPFECIYCSNSVYGKNVRRRSVENVISEIETVVKRFGIRHFYFVEDVLTLNKQFSLSLCDEIDKRGLKITFEGSTRANLFDEELAKRMSKSGLIRISFGLESADPKILKIIKKQVPLESYIQANKLTNKYGIETINSVMLGLPGQDRESIEKTITFLRKAKDIQHTTYGIAMPYPGTEFYEMAKKGEYGLKLHTEDFSKYQRYGSAVLSVGDLSPEDLIRLQKEGLLKIYLTSWRIWPMLKRVKLNSLVVPVWEAVCAIIYGLFKKNKNNLEKS